MLIKKITKAWLLSLFVVISGCSIWQNQTIFIDNSSDYLYTTERPKLKIPENFNVKPFVAIMPIPKENHMDKNKLSSFEIPAPASPLFLGDKYGFSLKTYQNYFVIESTADKKMLWDLIISYLKSHKIEVVNKSLQKGIIETAQIINSSQKISSLDKLHAIFGYKKDKPPLYALVVSNIKKIDNGFATITVSFKKLSKKSDNKNTSDKDFFKEQIENTGNDLLVFMAENSTVRHSNSNSLKKFDAKKMSSQITDGNGNYLLKITTDFDTAWKETAVALKKINFSIEKKNYNAGIFYVKLPKLFVIPEELNSELTNKEKTNKDTLFRLILSPAKEEIYVSFEKNSNTIVSKELNTIVLKDIRDAMITK